MVSIGRGMLLSLIFIMVFLAFLILFPPTTQGLAQEGKFIGESICMECHEDIYKYYSHTPHRGVNGCENCHGPGREHVESEGDPALIFMFKGVSSQEAIEVCLKCHRQQKNRYDYPRSDHGLNRLVCNTCHQPHQPRLLKYLLKNPEVELCYSCHKEIRAQFSLSERHGVPEGIIKCSDCHNAHTRMKRSMISRLDRENLCGKCHRDKTGPFVYEHESSLVDGCLTCHRPHGSVNRYLLIFREDRLLCLSCHSALPGFHNNVNFGGRRCTDCHTAIHGSNVSSVFFR